MYNKESKTKKMSKIFPVSATIDNKKELIAESLSSCERPCVCVCVCRHGGSKALDFKSEEELLAKELYKEFIEIKKSYKK